MKIYVCVWHDFDESGIEKVFTDKVQAQIYAELHSCTIDEQETADGMYDPNEYKLFTYYKAYYDMADLKKGAFNAVHLDKHIGVEGHTELSTAAAFTSIRYRVLNIKADNEDDARDQIKKLYNEYKEKYC